MRSSVVIEGTAIIIGAVAAIQTHHAVFVHGDQPTSAPIIELTTIDEGPGLGHPTGTNLPVSVHTSSICRAITTQTCDVIEVTLSASQPVDTATLGKTSSFSKSPGTSSTKESTHIESKTASTSNGKETSSMVTATQTGVTPSATSGASKAEVALVCFIAGFIFVYLL
ncbi:hypothetical protein CORC01_02576 [Colletotrichum orchidophilum]|uniref:Uncharacterized protein n=1 Tax=Colletotrichum orchidophilum TaxID=1209926 RepID=A0A1G4BL18_9PEZI|nr:uncharacterized protein CORC01_02576 [Colletotrichum orchidophilum]OHF01997.1 hypothetical protein CORC01_02576 [Colletotrichum orchidophilum]